MTDAIGVACETLRDATDMLADCGGALLSMGYPDWTGDTRTTFEHVIWASSTGQGHPTEADAKADTNATLLASLTDLARIWQQLTKETP